MLSLVEEYKLGKARLFQMLHDSHDPLVKNAQPSVITGRKWKTKIAVENAESAHKKKEIIGTVANGKVGLGLHLQRWWSKESPANRRKMVSEEIHHFEEVRRFATTVGQRKQSAWQVLKHMEPKKLSFLLKAVYDVLPTPTLMLGG